MPINAIERKKVKSLIRVRLFATPWTVAHQAPPSMGFSRQEYWSGLPFPSPGDIPDPGIEPRHNVRPLRHKSFPLSVQWLNSDMRFDPNSFLRVV